MSQVLVGTADGVALEGPPLPAHWQGNALQWIVYEREHMNVNHPTQPPLTIEERATVILRTLDLPQTDQVYRRRIKTFVTSNGYQPVLDAARYTARQAAKETISDPWAYTIQVYNGNLARLSHLYGLVHWAENGLRSQLDLNYARVLGPTWHAYPDQYLPLNSVANFLAVHERLSLPITAVAFPTGRGVVQSWQIVTPATPGEFLESVTTGWLVSMARYLHRRSRARAILVRLDGQQTSPQEAETFFGHLKAARNAVAHNHYMSNEEFARHHDTLLVLLTVLHFDVATALSRVDALRADLVRTTIARLKS